jgi:hypothetical protein
MGRRKIVPRFSRERGEPGSLGLEAEDHLDSRSEIYMRVTLNKIVGAGVAKPGKGGWLKTI